MKDIFDLTGRVAIVTGASSGIGVQFAKALASKGASVVLLARRKEKLEDTKKAVEAMGAKALAIACDVTQEDQVKAAVDQTIAEFGQIDILVNNAGTILVQDTADIDLAEWQRIVDINMNAVFLMVKHVAPHMVKQQHGRIINIGSMNGLRAHFAANIPTYYATKGAIVQLTRGWAQEYAKNGITVNSIAPGMFPSEIMVDDGTDEFNGMVHILVPIGRMGRLEELDGLVIYLASDNASYITGQTIPLDGGKTII